MKRNTVKMFAITLIAALSIQPVTNCAWWPFGGAKPKPKTICAVKNYVVKNGSRYGSKALGYGRSYGSKALSFVGRNKLATLGALTLPVVAFYGSKYIKNAWNNYGKSALSSFNSIISGIKNMQWLFGAVSQKDAHVKLYNQEKQKELAEFKKQITRVAAKKEKTQKQPKKETKKEKKKDVVVVKDDKKQPSKKEEVVKETETTKTKEEIVVVETKKENSVKKVAKKTKKKPANTYCILCSTPKQRKAGGKRWVEPNKCACGKCSKGYVKPKKTTRKICSGGSCRWV